MRNKIDFLFEVSWEVCNKVGGIHTVIATKAKTLQDQFGDKYILIGPDIWKDGYNPEFTEDTSLLQSFREQAVSEDMKIRIGRWKISSHPIVILVDFASLFAQKNEIFTDLWHKFQLDSLSGGWDYIEPTLFAYASAKVIESYYRHNLVNNEKVVAQFHEWMTGAGVLYLNTSVPQIATVFTTHATVLGRAIAGSGVSFYSLFDSFVPEKAAKDFNVVSKNSLEKIAANVADCFTTVSDITAKECVKFLGRMPDVITHNGFDVSILPDENLFEKNRSHARNKIIRVAEGLFNQNIPSDSLLVIKSGRYEYRNKGINIFIDSLAELKRNDKLDKTVLGIIFVPAHHAGPRKELLERIDKQDFSYATNNQILTHSLYGAESDPILKDIEKGDLNNLEDDKVKIMFVPTYLDGNDGVFNMHYYDLLIGFDLAIFPSYYEPWGYTPLESIAYHIPSVTTSISGFGTMVGNKFNGGRPGITVINRTDTNEKEVVSQASKIIFDFTKKTAKEIQEAKTDAHNLSLNFLWDKLIAQYEKAYDIAVSRSIGRSARQQNSSQAVSLAKFDGEFEPIWRSVSIEANFPDKLAALQKLIKNLWWSWNYDAEELFEYIDADLWDKSGHNPILFTRQLSFPRIKQLTKDKTFLKLLDNVESKFDQYMAYPLSEKPHIAYFSMEYGLCSFIKLYSGGLGVLAGDYLKEASDAGMNITGVGLLYKNGYFRQKFSVHGEQLAEPDTQDFSTLPLQLVTKEDLTPLTINLAFPGRNVAVQIWKLSVGRIALYLLDTDISQNTDEDRTITSYLYQGNKETRLKQEIVLGIGGIRALTALKITPDICHCNEGHASFIGIERIQNLVRDQNLTFEDAVEVVRASSLFTTHTSVPAANDIFSEELLRKYLSDKSYLFNIDLSKFIGFGRLNPNDQSEEFSMTYLGARLSQEINAVSKIHQKVSRKLLNPLWKNFKKGELHIGGITNGVHYTTWASKQWQQFARIFLGVTDSSDISDALCWQRLNDVPAKEIWNIRVELKKRLIEAVKIKLQKSAFLNNKPNTALGIVNHLNEDALIIGFARRFVTYKRSGLLFTSLERLSRIIGNPEKPVIFIFSGKAHPMDTESIHLINQLVDVLANPELKYSVIFLEDYDMDIARVLVQGVDVWLNTPYRHVEASGTSGMKAALNGVINFSVLDGWWAEAYNGSNGWMLSEEPIHRNNDLQNQLDAETIYNTFEHEIIPLFFDREKDGVPHKWIEKIKASLMSIVPQFNMQRALLEYRDKYYESLSGRVDRLKSNNYSIVKSLTSWKRNILSHWSDVKVLSIDMPGKEMFKSLLGDLIRIVVVLDIGELSRNDVGIELIISGSPLKEGYYSKEFSIIYLKGQEVTYECVFRMEQTGTFDFAFRIFPKHPDLPHRQDFDLMKWI